MADAKPGKTPGTWTRRIAGTTLGLAVLVLLAGPTIKFGILPWNVALLMFVIAAVLAGIGGIISLVALLRRRGGFLAVLGAAAGLAALLIPVAIIADGRGKPPIHDITTDTANPPKFVAITPAVRGADSNPVTYDPAIAPLQTAAYPKLRTLVLPEAPALVFEKAVAAAKASGWEIVDTDEFTGRIEATATVPWWGFKDDIVIRISPDGTGAKVDVRSKSRVGKGDLGVNAQRIADYLERLAG
jgi:hypothetical protein